MKVGHVGIIVGIKDKEEDPGKKHCEKSFALSYDANDPKLYSPAKITIGEKIRQTTKALWDTGATITAISHATAEHFNAVPQDFGVSISATGRNDANIYLATIELPGGIVFHDVEVWDVDLSDHGAEVVIGMDIIARGRLVVETVNGTPMFSFSVEC